MFSGDCQNYLATILMLEQNPPKKMFKIYKKNPGWQIELSTTSDNMSYIKCPVRSSDSELTTYAHENLLIAKTL